MSICQCIKKDGNQCSFKTTPPSLFCGIHKNCTISDTDRPEPEPEQPNAFSVLPKELIEHILSFTNPQDLHQIKQVDRRLWNEVQDKYQSYVRKARKQLGVYAKPFTDAQLMSRISHLSDGQYDATGIQIKDAGHRWEKGSQSITVIEQERGNQQETWESNNKYHRLDGPALIQWNKHGHKTLEEWYKNGLLHRLDGPAKTSWHTNGQLLLEDWFVWGYRRLRLAERHV
jgi:hypothetical protein